MKEVLAHNDRAIELIITNGNWSLNIVVREQEKIAMDIGTNTTVVNSQPSKPTLIRVLGSMVNVVKTSIVTMVK